MTDTGGVAGDRLKSFVERVERLEEERRAPQEDIKEVYSEAKASGFDTKIMRLVVRERRMDDDARDERDALLDIYKRGLGMLSDLPLGQAAQAKAEEYADAELLKAASTRGRQAALDGKPRDNHPYRHTHQRALRDAFRAAYDAAKNAPPKSAKNSHEEHVTA
jgi:uncharacterized protein (UPF0335 family)/ribosome modulation factor